MTLPLEVDKQPIDWAPIEQALHEWLVPAIVPALIWEDQKVAQPAEYPYASAKITAGPIEEGGGEEIRQTYDATQEEGQEIEVLAVAPVAMTLTLSFHNAQVQGERGLRPDELGRAIAAKARASLGLPSTLDALSAVGVAIVRKLGVVDTSLTVNGDWVSRGTLDVRIRVTSVVSEYQGYIDKVEISAPDLGVPETTIDGS